MDAPARQRHWVLIVLCVASAGWGFSFGLSVPLGSLWLGDAGYGAAVRGLSTAIYYLGVALAAPLLPWIMKRSRLGVVVAGMILDGVTTALFPWVHGIPAWFLLRFISGVATALCLIPMETWVNHNAAPSRRARDFGLYAVSVALGVGLGQVIGLHLYKAVDPYFAFALGGTIAAAMALLVGCGLRSVPTVPEAAEEHGSLPLAPAFISLGTAFVQGFLEGGMLTFLAGYLLGLGHADAMVNGLLAALFCGVVLFQIPGALLADRLGRIQLVLACHAVVVLGLIALPWCTGPLVLAGGLFLVGACCAALYPLGLALLGESVAPSALPRANAWYLACNCAGSLIGPWLMGEAIDRFGPRSMFATASTASIVVVCAWLMIHLLQRRGTFAHRNSASPTSRAA